MGKKLISDSILTAIANAIRNKRGTTTQYKPSEMANAILNIPTGGGGGITPAGTLPITENNRVYDCYQYAEASVQIPTPSDVLEITENGTYGVQGYGSVDVDVPQGQQPTGTFYAVANGSYDVRDYANVNVLVLPTQQDTYVRDNDVVFIKADGTPLTSYSFDEVLELENLPVGTWNYTLAQLQQCANDGYPVVVGGLQNSSDTVLEFESCKDLTGIYVPLNVTLNNFTGSVSVDYQSDNPMIQPPVGQFEEYENETGVMTIGIGVTDPEFTFTVTITKFSGSYKLGGDDMPLLYQNDVICRLLRKVTIGSDCAGILEECFGGCSGLKKIVFPSTPDATMVIEDYALGSDHVPLENVVVPSSIGAKLNNLGREFFRNVMCKYVSLSPGMTSDSEVIFNKAIGKISLPPGILTVENFLENDQVVAHIPSSATSLTGYASTTLRKLYMHGQTNLLNAGAFSAAVSRGMKVYVPSNKLTWYRNATNWSEIASSIEPITS